MLLWNQDLLQNKNFPCYFREQEQELENKIPWLQQKSQIEASNQHLSPLKQNPKQVEFYSNCFTEMIVVLKFKAPCF